MTSEELVKRAWSTTAVIVVGSSLLGTLYAWKADWTYSASMLVYGACGMFSLLRLRSAIALSRSDSHPSAPAPEHPPADASATIPGALDWNDARWSELCGGYRSPYDPRPALARLAQPAEAAAAFAELWDELHHQGDVDTASYAAVPHLVQLYAKHGQQGDNTYAILGIIELARHAGRNPSLPEWLRDGYDNAWRRLGQLALDDLARATDPSLARSAMGAIAIARGMPQVGEILLESTDDEIEEMLTEYRGKS
jgi:hypothetical protein